MIAIAVLAIAGLHFWQFRGAAIAAALEAEGIPTTAEIVELRDYSGFRSTGDTLIYRYQVDGTTFEGREKIEDGAADFWAGLSTAPIRYLPGDPATARLVGNSQSQNWALLILFDLTLAIALIVLWRRHKRGQP
ncbi:DUF3592 domain-containing protein [Aurantiacibacter gangjinensis]|uniref:DUF3592 domain-containing protein n=1 Tax=Aurantiacibacter gangjinensis TaxID=502682 RepID=A0A0G9MPY8_9SPHN|nr:DUF3592 domain-containing protein [Aurantiacibacter gangjinensis]APE27255.1 hypothetical protein BMF35_a0426 [Aurantiacibacter gangjinensis]KLE31373.1 hypothetical protein AAW01_07145 [Aurantiacibacter gangjinensis]